jgi:hypothetical protein
MSIELRGSNEIYSGPDGTFDYYLSLHHDRQGEFGMLIVRTKNYVQLDKLLSVQYSDTEGKTFKGKTITLETRDKDTWLIFNQSYGSIQIKEQKFSFYFSE